MPFFSSRYKYPFLLPFLVLFFNLTGPFTHAQVMTASPDSTTNSVPNKLSPVSLDSISPDIDLPKFRMSPVAKSAAYLVAGAGIWTATYLWLDEPLQRNLSQNFQSKAANGVSSAINPLGRQKYWIPVSGAVSLSGILFKNANFQKFGMISMGSLFLSGGFTTLGKNKTSRHRPDRSAKNNVYDWGAPGTIHRSFPSAHATVAFAVATSFSAVYGQEYRFASPLAYSAATLVGMARMYDNAHWATDIMAGAASGYLSAKGTAYLYALAESKLKLRKEQLLITPQVGLGSGDLRATLTF